MCEAMASLVCNSSQLKSPIYRLKRKTFRRKICNKCDLGIVEDIKHLEMQCPYYNDERIELQESLGSLNSEIATRVMNDSQNFSTSLWENILSMLLFNQW